MEVPTDDGQAVGDDLPDPPTEAPSADVMPAQDDILARDHKLVLKLLQVGTDNELWVRTRQRLGEHALPYLVLMAYRGEIHREARKKLGRKRVRHIPNLALDPDSARQLATEMIRRAHEPFSTSSVVHWTPEKGRLTQYFVGCCLLQFPNSWQALWGRIPPEQAPKRDALSRVDMGLDLASDAGQIGEDLVARNPSYEDPGELVPRQQAARKLIGQLHAEDPDVIELALLKANGYSESKALAILGEGSGLKSKSWRRRKTWRTNGREEEDV